MNLLIELLVVFNTGLLATIAFILYDRREATKTLDEFEFWLEDTNDTPRAPRNAKNSTKSKNTTPAKSRLKQTGKATLKTTKKASNTVKKAVSRPIKKTR